MEISSVHIRIGVRPYARTKWLGKQSGAGNGSQTSALEKLRIACGQLLEREVVPLVVPQPLDGETPLAQHARSLAPQNFILLLRALAPSHSR